MDNFIFVSGNIYNLVCTVNAFYFLKSDVEESDFFYQVAGKKTLLTVLYSGRRSYKL